MNTPLMTIVRAEFTATVQRNGTTTYTNHTVRDCSKDVRLLTGYFVIENRDRRYVRRFDQLTAASEARLRAIAEKIRPAVKGRNAGKRRNGGNGHTSSRRRLTAVQGLAIVQAHALAELVDRVNGGEQ